MRCTMEKQWYIGCSGFAYKEWKDAFYPPKLAQNKWFDYYTRHFNTLELNTTFYRFPTLKSLQGWYDKAPSQFTFSAKVPRSITHYNMFNETNRMMQDFYGLLKEGLNEKLGCVLIQLPPQFSFDLQKLENILSQIDPSCNNVIEFRNESWWRKDVQKILQQHHTSFCGVSFPKIQFDDAVTNTEISYYRFHGVPHLFYSEYQPSFIEKIITRLKNSRNAKTIYLYFNNTASMAAVKNARYAL